MHSVSLRELNKHLGLDLAHALLCAIDNTAALLLMSLLLLNRNPVMMMMMAAATLSMMIALMTTGIISTRMSSLDPPLPLDTHLNSYVFLHLLHCFCFLLLYFLLNQF